MVEIRRPGYRNTGSEPKGTTLSGVIQDAPSHEPGDGYSVTFSAHPNNFFRKVRDAVTKPFQMQRALMAAKKEITNSAGFNAQDPVDVAVRVLCYMNRHFVSTTDMAGAPARDAASWSGEQVVLHGNFNGCVEAVRAFMTLFAMVSPCQQQYISSFSLKGAQAIQEEMKKLPQQRNQDLINNPPGHALVELYDPLQDSPVILDVTAAMGNPNLNTRISEAELNETHGNDVEGFFQGKIIQYRDAADILVQRTQAGFQVEVYPFEHLRQPSLKQSTQTFDALDDVLLFLNNNYTRLPDLSDLNNDGLVKREASDHTIQLDGGEWGGTYVIFTKTPICPYKDQFGKNGSSTKTREAIMRYLELSD